MAGLINSTWATSLSLLDSQLRRRFDDALASLAQWLAENAMSHQRPNAAHPLAGPYGVNIRLKDIAQIDLAVIVKRTEAGRTVAKDAQSPLWRSERTTPLMGQMQL